VARAQALRARGQALLAGVELGRALGADFDNIKAHVELAFLLKRQAQLTGDEELWAAVESELRTVLSLRPEPENAIALGNLLLNRGRPGEAVHLFERAIELAGDSPEASRRLCVALLAAERPRDALRACQEAVDLEPQHLGAIRNLARAHLLTGDYDAAARMMASGHGPKAEQAAVLRQELASPALAAAFLARCSDTLEGERPGEALGPCRQAARLAPGALRARVGLARAQAAAGLAEEAVRTLEEALAQHPDEPELLAELADIRTRAGID